MGFLDSKTDTLTSLFNELSKFHVELDGLGRESEMYSAPVDTIHGGPCVVSRFQYDGNSTTIIGMREEKAVWDSAWDF